MLHRDDIAEIETCCKCMTLDKLRVERDKCSIFLMQAKYDKMLKTEETNIAYSILSIYDSEIAKRERLD